MSRSICSWRSLVWTRSWRNWEAVSARRASRLPPSTMGTRGDVEFTLLVEVVGASALLAELGGGFGAPGVPPAAVENGHAQGEAIVPGGQKRDRVAVDS